MKRESGWRQAQRLFAADACSTCGGSTQLVRHHRDRDPVNNVEENILVLCRACHVRLHLSEDGQQRGERNSQAKLTDEAVRRIRASATSQRELALEFGVDPSLISLVRARKVWGHVA